MPLCPWASLESRVLHLVCWGICEEVQLCLHTSFTLLSSGTLSCSTRALAVERVCSRTTQVSILGSRLKDRSLWNLLCEQLQT